MLVAALVVVNITTAVVLGLLVNKCLGVLEKLTAPPPLLPQPEMPAEQQHAEWSGSRGVFMPDVEMDDWINNNGMPNSPGWMETQETPDQLP